MLIYLDNCCYNRPYDDQSYMRINLLTQAKLHIQEQIKNDVYQLAASFILIYENECNPYVARRTSISTYLGDNVSEYVGEEGKAEVIKIAEDIMKTGIKMKDSYHLASAIYLNADYFITTDDRVKKYSTDRIKIVDPIEFIKQEEE